MSLPIEKHIIDNVTTIVTAQKTKFSIKDFFSKCDQICSFQRISAFFVQCVVFNSYNSFNTATVKDKKNTKKNAKPQKYLQKKGDGLDRLCEMWYLTSLRDVTRACRKRCNFK